MLCRQSPNKNRQLFISHNIHKARISMRAGGRKEPHRSRGWNMMLNTEDVAYPAYRVIASPRISATWWDEAHESKREVYFFLKNLIEFGTSLFEKFFLSNVRSISYIFVNGCYRGSTCANLRSRCMHRARTMLNVCCPADHRTAREFRVISIPRQRSPVNSGLVLQADVYNSRGDKIRRVVVNCGV